MTNKQRKRQIVVFLILMIFGGACSTEQKLISKEIKITVLDKNNNLPIDSARVILVSIVEARDIHTDVKYTDSVGLCSFSLAFNPVTQYQIGTIKEGFLSYLDDDSVDIVRSFAIVNEKTDENMVLYLTSDSMHQINYWKKKTVRYDTDTLINLLKSNKYPDRIGFPLLYWEDIPGLLTVGNDRTLINHFPINPISSTLVKECYVGIISLWFIESIRITELKKVVHPFEKFPSQIPALRYMSNPELTPNNIEYMEKAYQAYQTWWGKIKNMDKEDGCKINPLENTNLEW